MIGIPLLVGSCLCCGGAGYLAHKNHQVKKVRLQAEAEMAKKKEEELEAPAEQPVDVEKE